MRQSRFMGTMEPSRKTVGNLAYPELKEIFMSGGSLEKFRGVPWGKTKRVDARGVEGFDVRKNVSPL